MSSSSSRAPRQRAVDKPPLHEDVAALLERLKNAKLADADERDRYEGTNGINRTRDLILQARGKPRFQRVLDKGLRMAILSRLPKTALLCVNSGADPNFRPTLTERTTLLLAIDSLAGPLRRVAWNSDQQHSYGTNPVFFLAMMPVVLALVDNGADIFARVHTHRQLSPARRCAELGPQVLEQLLARQRKQPTKEELTEFVGDACTGFYINAKHQRHLLEDPTYLGDYDNFIARAFERMFAKFPESVWPDFNVPSPANGLYPIHALCSMSLFGAAECISRPRGDSYTGYALMTARCRFPRRDPITPRARIWPKGDMLQELAIAPSMLEITSHEEQWEFSSVVRQMFMDELIEEDGVNAMDLWVSYARSVVSVEGDEEEDEFGLIRRGFEFFESRALLPTSMTFFYAVRANYVDMIEFLLMHKREYINLKARDYMGKTVLHWTCMWETPQIRLRYRDFTSEEERERAGAQSEEARHILDRRVSDTMFDLYFDERSAGSELNPSDRLGRSIWHFLATNPFVSREQIAALWSEWSVGTPYDGMDREPMQYLMLACPTEERVRELEIDGYHLTTRRQISYIRSREFSNRPIRDRMGLTPLHFFVMGAPDYPDVAKMIERGNPLVDWSIESYDYVIGTLKYLAMVFGAHPPSVPDEDYDGDGDAHMQRMKRFERREYDFVTYLRPLHLAAAYGNSMVMILLLFMIGMMREAEEGNYTYRGRGRGDDISPEDMAGIFDHISLQVLTVPTKLAQRGVQGVFSGIGRTDQLNILKALHTTDSHGNLPIHYAVASGDPDIVFNMLKCEQCLKRQGSHRSENKELDRLKATRLAMVPDGRGRTPLHLAREYNNHRTAEVISENLEMADDLGDMLTRSLSLRDSRGRTPYPAAPYGFIRSGTRGQPYVPQEGDLNMLLEAHARGDELVDRPIPVIE